MKFKILSQKIIYSGVYIYFIILRRTEWFWIFKLAVKKKFRSNQFIVVEVCKFFLIALIHIYGN